MADVNSTPLNTLDAMDTTNSRLTQARAVLGLVVGRGTDENRFETSHSEIMSALWAVQSLLDQAQDALGAISLRGAA
jgi:hypothetical protein